jgi:putative two-component system response regulator
MGLIDDVLGDRYTCEFASSIDETREELATGTFQLAICDTQVVGESGIVLAEEIIGKHPGTAVILVVGEDDPEIAEQAFGFGAHGYLVKPFWPGQLLITTMNALRRRELEIATRTQSLDLEARLELIAVRLRAELSASQQHAIDELELSRQETVERLAKAIGLHDSSTGQHVDRMAAIVSFLGSHLHLDDDYVQLLRAAAPMHDVGKIGTSDEILRKPGPLTGDERKEMERHTTIGHEILANSESELLRIAASIALTHHERYDGGGYPQGLAGEEIPLEGRITAVADVFDALLSDRCYRPALPVDKAVATIREGRGAHFDPQVADVLLDHLPEVLSLRG